MPDSDAVPAPSSAAHNQQPSAGKRLTSWRSSHRARNHDSAHADEEQPPLSAEMLQHPLVPTGDVELVIDQAAFDALIAELRNAGSFAYDTEFIGELTYHPVLCLIQVATTERVALIDPMAMLELGGLWELLADPSVEKIVHAGEQDVEPVARHLGNSRGANNVMDTQIAAGFVGMAYPVSLAKLVLEVLGVKLAKGLTFTHWDQRPLSPVQLRYAADDVRYLPAVWSIQKEKLAELGHRRWSDEECAAMCEPTRFGFKPDATHLKIRGASTLSANSLAVLKALTIWRDGAAKREDVPPRALLKDDVLIELARSPIRSLDRLQRVRGLPRPVEADYGRDILETTLAALESGLSNSAVARSVEPTPTERFSADALHAIASAMIAGQGIDPALVMNRQELIDFHRKCVIERQPVEKTDLMIGWRAEAVGNALIELIEGRKSVQMDWKTGQLRLN